MPRPRKTEAQRRAERFLELYRIGKARIGFTENDVGRALGICKVTLWRKKKELLSGDNTQQGFSFLEMVTLGKLFGWSEEEFASIYRAEKTGEKINYWESTPKMKEAKKMTCFYCKGQAIETTTKFIVDLGPCVVIVKNVPALVCQQCGEASYSNEVAQQLEKIVEAVKHSIMSEIAIIDYLQAA